MSLILHYVFASALAAQPTVQLIGVTSNLPNSVGFQKPNEMVSLTVSLDGSNSNVTRSSLIKGFQSWHTNSVRRVNAGQPSVCRKVGNLRSVAVLPATISNY